MVIGDGWTILDEDPICRTNLVAFDPEKMKKLGCPIVTATMTITMQNGQRIAIIVGDAVYNKGSPILLCSKYQTRKLELLSIWWHGDTIEWTGTKGTQSIFLNDDTNTVIPMTTCGALLCFQHWKPATSEALNALPKHFMTNVGPWEPQRFYDGEDTLELPTSPTTDAYCEAIIQTATATITTPTQGIHPDPPRDGLQHPWKHQSNEYLMNPREHHHHQKKTNHITLTLPIKSMRKHDEDGLST